jgi:uncharacterized protein Smg (DUF494 family)
MFLAFCRVLSLNEYYYYCHGFVVDIVQVMKVAKCPTDELSLTNCAVVNEHEFDLTRVKYGTIFILFDFLIKFVILSK